MCLCIGDGERYLQGAGGPDASRDLREARVRRHERQRAARRHRDQPAGDVAAPCSAAQREAGARGAAGAVRELRGRSAGHGADCQMADEVSRLLAGAGRGAAVIAEGYGPMSDIEAQELESEEQTKDLVFDYELDAPLEKVWRALSIAAFREKWLPGLAPADAEPLSSTPCEEISYRLRDDEPPFLDSVVTFQVGPNADGGTRLRIIHGLLGARSPLKPPQAANNNGVCL